MSTDKRIEFLTRSATILYLCYPDDVSFRTVWDFSPGMGKELTHTAYPISLRLAEYWGRESNRWAATHKLGSKFAHVLCYKLFLACLALSILSLPKPILSCYTDLEETLSEVT